MMRERQHAASARTARVEERVIRFLEEAAPEMAWTGTESPLFGDGRLDSLALINLVTWVEEQIGARIDPATFDLRSEWATVGGVAAFIARHGAPADESR
jgi:acyl carrier protein